MNALDQKWDWRIAMYLFLAGTGAGAYALVSFFEIIGLAEGIIASVIFPAIFLIGAGCVFLLWDLGQPIRFWRVLLNPFSSLISVGAWFITCFLLVAALSYFVDNSIFHWLGLLLAIGTATYTGLLLGVVRARPLWNTPLLPVLFLISALSTGIALATIIFSLQYGQPFQLLGYLEVSHKIILMLEIVSLLSYLLIMRNTGVAGQAGVAKIITGSLFGHFWVGVIGLGLLLPMVLPGSILSACSGLVGGFLLRYVIIQAGDRYLLPGEENLTAYGIEGMKIYG